VDCGGELTVDHYRPTVADGDVTAHYRYDETTGRMEPLTETGRFHIALLRLNRPELVAHRLRQQIAEATAEQLRLEKGFRKWQSARASGNVPTVA
jgi:hypothetical protein